MSNITSTIKNPLTVIAIFSSIAELGGAAALPFLELESQQIYIWFLMLFPLVLILLFFITLNWNHKVLYAPSDYSNEDNFVNLLKKPTIEETIEKLEEDRESIEDEIKEQKPKQPLNQDKEFELGQSIKHIANLDEKDKPIFDFKVQKKKILDWRMVELLILGKLEKQLGTPIQREVTLKAGDSRVMFDGVAVNGPSLTAIEIKIMHSTKSFTSPIWDKMFYSFRMAYQSLKENQKDSFSIILVIVTNHNEIEVERVLNQRAKELAIPLSVKVYNLGGLESELA
ncbi:MAG: hypothetical protein ACI8RP_001614 [Urechidicola sp.]|jgi:hypothetical protein